MNVRRFFDRIQVSCHLLGLHRIANFFGRFGSPVIEVKELSFEDRPTLECPVFIPPEAKGDGYCLDSGEVAEPLKVLNFDPTFNNNPDIDVAKDVVYATSKYDVN